MKTRIVLIGLFSGLLFGIATPFSKIILEELNSFQLAGLLYLGATRSQILFSTAPFWGIIAAWIFLHEPLNLTVLISFLLLVSGIIFTNFATHGHPHYHKKIVHIHQHNHDDGHHNHIYENDNDNSLNHSHLHEHKEMKHTHKHYPDLHHRHEH